MSTIRRCRLTGFILTTAWVGSRGLPLIRRFPGGHLTFFLPRDWEMGIEILIKVRRSEEVEKKKKMAGLPIRV